MIDEVILQDLIYNFELLWSDIVILDHCILPQYSIDPDNNWSHFVVHVPLIIIITDHNSQITQSGLPDDITDYDSSTT